MDNFDSALHRIAVLEAHAAQRAPADVAAVLDPVRLRGQVYRGGELVRDLVTGQEGTVEHSSFAHGPVTAP